MRNSLRNSASGSPNSDPIWPEVCNPATFSSFRRSQVRIGVRERPLFAREGGRVVREVRGVEAAGVLRAQPSVLVD